MNEAVLRKIGIPVLLATLIALAGTPAPLVAACLGGKTPAEKACASACCAKQPCCAHSGKSAPQPQVVFTKGNTHELAFSVFPNALLFAGAFPSCRAQPRPVSDSLGSPPPTRAFLCTFLI